MFVSLQKIPHNLNPIKRGSSGHNTCWWFEVCMQTTYFRRERNSFFNSHWTEGDIERRHSRVVASMNRPGVKGIDPELSLAKGEGDGGDFSSFSMVFNDGDRKI